MKWFHIKDRKPDLHKRFGLTFLLSVPSPLWIKYAALIYIGFGSIISQILLVREFLVSFHGNELSIGIVFSMWLIWIGLGSISGNSFIKNSTVSTKLFASLIALTPVVTFIQILIVKYARLFFDSTSGVFLSITELLIFSFAALSFGCFLWGLLFTYGAVILTANKAELWHGVNKAYILESFGSVVGGIIFSFYLSPLFSTTQIILLLMAFAITIAVQFIFPLNKRKISILIIIAAVIYCAFLKPTIWLEYQINKHQWSLINNKLIYVNSTDTKYQNLSLLQLGNQHTIYANGKPVLNIPDTYESEIFVHSIMIHNINAKNVLVIGGGFNGVLNEILKYPSTEIDYIEIDSSLIMFTANALTKQDRQAINSNRVDIIYCDGREYLLRANKVYDVIILNVGEPSTASINRFFTLEFYQQCKLRLSKQGIIAFRVESSSEYISNELKSLNASLYHTLKQVFSNVLIIPGAHAIFIGSIHNQVLISNPDSLAHKFASAQISCVYFTKYMYYDLLLPERVRSITNLLESTTDFRLNTDNNPIVYFFDLLLWNRLVHSNNKIFAFITLEKIFALCALCIGIFLLLLFFTRNKSAAQNRIALMILIFAGGLTGMVLNLLLLLNFQQTFGSIYEMIGAMTAANIFGLALGANTVFFLTQKHHPKIILLILCATLVSIILLLPIILRFLISSHFLLLTLLANTFCGIIIGMLFGVVNKLYLKNSMKAGSVYAFDVFGSSIGALITCSILLPLLGVKLITLFLLLLLIPVVLSCLVFKSQI